MEENNIIIYNTAQKQAKLFSAEQEVRDRLFFSVPSAEIEIKQWLAPWRNFEYNKNTMPRAPFPGGCQQR